MARKSKEFADLLFQQQRGKRQEKYLKKFAKQYKTSQLGKDTQLILNPKGEVKMSEVLRQFVAPYHEPGLSLREYEFLLTIGVTAWNIALMPEDKRQESRESALEIFQLGDDAEAKAEIQSMMEAMIDRKQTEFSDIQRYVVDFQLRDDRDEFHLSVASTIVPSTEEAEETTEE